jgi:RNA polymerase sigma-70 factor (ECF subfamily)
MSDDLEGMSDEDLVRRVLSRDERAAAALYARHERLLRARARRRLVGGMRRKIGESDIVQQTYVAAFEDLGDFEDRGPGSFRRWLERVLDFQVNDEVKRHVGAAKRSAHREVSQATGDPAADPAGPEPTPSVHAIAAEERAALAAAMRDLPDDDRRVLDLVHRQGTDFGEAGRAMGRSADAARKLYARAVVRLSQRMRQSS